jgi:hypothetical protein
MLVEQGGAADEAQKCRIIQYPFQFFRITHNLNTVALMMKFSSTWALGQINSTYSTPVMSAAQSIAYTHESMCTRRCMGATWAA